MKMKTNKMISFIKDILGVKGIQSPKHPHVLIFPENKAQPVKKLKNMINTNNNHNVHLQGYLINKATPATIAVANTQQQAAATQAVFTAAGFTDARNNVGAKA